MSQGAIPMSAGGGGANVRSKIDGALQRLQTGASGTSRPTDIGTYELWIETDNPGAGTVTIWRWDGTHDVPIGTLNTTTGAFTPYANATITAAALPAGSIVDVQSAAYTSSSSFSSVIPTDGTIPQSGEGTQILSVSITPKKNTNKVLAIFTCHGAINASPGYHLVAALFKNSDTDAIESRAGHSAQADFVTTVSFNKVDSPASTSAQTYKVRVGPNASATGYVNGNSGGNLFGGVSTATLVLLEIQT